MKLLPLLLIPSLALADVTVNGTLSLRNSQDAGVAQPTEPRDSLGRSFLVPEPLTGALSGCSYSNHFNNQNEGAALDARNYTSATTTMTITQGSNFITLNASAINTVNTNARIATHRVFPYMDGQPLAVMWTFKRSAGQTGQANELVEMGLVSHSLAVAATDGVFFRWNSSGEFRAVSTFNSTDSQSAVLTPPTANATHTAVIFRRATGTDFFIDGLKVAAIEDAAQANPVSTRGVPFGARSAALAVAPAVAPNLQIGPVSVFRCGDADKPWGEKLSASGLSAVQAPLTPYATIVNHANSTSPTSATLANITPSYTTLGGRWQLAAPAGAATDFPLFGYQVPAGYQLYITSIAISSCNTVVAVATTPTIFDWSIAVDSSAASIATADSFGPPWVSTGPRRVTLGSQGFVVGALAGQCVPDIVRTFTPPLVVNPGRFVHTIVQIHTGTATATEIFRGDVMFTGYFE